MEIKATTDNMEPHREKKNSKKRCGSTMYMTPKMPLNSNSDLEYLSWCVMFNFIFLKIKGLPLQCNNFFFKTSFYAYFFVLSYLYIMVYFISGAEIVFVFMVVLLVFGANRIPDIARTLAKGIQQVKTASRDFREEIEKSAEAQGLDTKELQKEVNDIKKELNEITGTVKRKR
jgi:sec-independent protein translocase protein TatA